MSPYIFPPIVGQFLAVALRLAHVYRHHPERRAHAPECPTHERNSRDCPCCQVSRQSCLYLRRRKKSGISGQGGVHWMEPSYQEAVVSRTQAEELEDATGNTTAIDPHRNIRVRLRHSILQREHPRVSGGKERSESSAGAELGPKTSIASLPNPFQCSVTAEFSLTTCVLQVMPRLLTTRITTGRRRQVWMRTTVGKHNIRPFFAFPGDVG